MQLIRNVVFNSQCPVLESVILHSGADSAKTNPPHFGGHRFVQSECLSS
jgi:hypothetical protein